MYIRNTVEYQAIFNRVLEKVFEDTTSWLLDKLRKQIVADVYNSHGRNFWYYDGTTIPTMQFYHAWEWTEVKRNMKEWVKKLYMNKETLEYDEYKWLHGSPISGSVVDSLDDILNLVYEKYRPGYTSSLHLSVYRRPYWNNFIEKWIISGKLQKRIESKLRGELGSRTKIIAIGRKAVAE